jgi:hypothetical protein
MVQSQGNQAEVQGYAHYVNLSFNRGNFTHKIGLDLAGGLALLLSYNPLLDNKDLREIIIQSSIKKTPDGYRIFNLEEAFKICKNFKK